ncbi:hypothetical protein [Solicola sp. PLA-1-18]|uniref:hypothetical protein n=1 Tax=Solicola sp. PLA-1-18 TaxID=3380532 RepID=UPI003B7762F3
MAVPHSMSTPPNGDASLRRAPAAEPVAMVAVDFDPDGLTIAPCRPCLQVWWAELVLVGRRVQLREWHRSSCPDWGDVVSYPTPTSAGLTARHPVVRGSGIRGLHTAHADPGGDT